MSNQIKIVAACETPTPGDSSAAVDFDQVIKQELCEIVNRRAARGQEAARCKEEEGGKKDKEAWQRECHKRKLFGVCISGGGIRSATFALGVLQGLAKKKLLQQADYVSTVSGGGYIGSWLQRVLNRPIEPDAKNKPVTLEQLYEPLTREVPGPASEDPITFLRKYSNYLAPRHGFSLDTLLIPMIWFRNTILNQVIITAAFLAALVPAFWPGTIFLSLIRLHQPRWLWWSMLVGAFVAGLWAVWFMGTNLKRIARSVREADEKQKGAGAGQQEKQKTERGRFEYPAGKATRYVGWFLVFPIFLAVLLMMFLVYGSGAVPETGSRAAATAKAKDGTVSASIKLGESTVASLTSPQESEASANYTLTANASEDRAGMNTTTTVTVSSSQNRPHTALTVQCKSGSLANEDGCAKGTAPLRVTASTESSKDDKAKITSSAIDFDDDTPPEKSMVAQHVYTAPGTYTITGTVTNDLGVSASDSKTVKVEGEQDSTALFNRYPYLWMALKFALFLILFAVLQERGGFRKWLQKRRKDGGKGQDWIKWGHLAWMSTACAGFTLLLVKLIRDLVWHWRPQGVFGSQLAMAYAPPLYVLALMAGVVLQIGLMGRDFPDASREWLSRAGTLFLTVSALWAGYFTLAVLVPYWIAQAYTAHYGGRSLTSAVAVWVGTTAASVFAGKSPKTNGVQSDKSDPSKAGDKKTSVLLDFIARYGAFVAIGGFLVLLALAAQWLLHVASAKGCECNLRGLGINELAQQYWYLFKAGSNSCWYWPVALTAGAATIFFVLSWRVNINEFSMHHFYKNRLVRCYLGARAANGAIENASNRKKKEQGKNRRQPDWFTGFDPKDDIPLDDLKWREEKKPHEERGEDEPSYPALAPYPILNATVNVTAGTDLATQERKGLSWIFTPLYSGFFPSRSDKDREDRVGQGQEAEQLGKTYRPTSQLGSGIALGTAMAISGAAANPNWGYHSSPQTAFLLTLFNVRLGWWIGNPTNERAFRRPGPGVALRWLFRELLGFVDESSAYLNLSDGGHFENLGLYELARRRCRYIIAVDGEEDRDYRFEALGGAVRKCRDDFGINIVINPRPIQLKDGLSRAHCVVGRIHYPVKEYPDDYCHRDIDQDRKPQPGWLLYLKSSITGDEPADVEEYRREHPDFPQQSTLDQFFTESQFESYRMLGQHALNAALDFYEEPGSREQKQPKRLPEAPKSATGISAGILSSILLYVLGAMMKGRAKEPKNKDGDVNASKDPCRKERREEMEEFCRRLSARWEVPPQVPEGAFSRHAEAYSNLMDRVTKNPNLAKLSGDMGKGFPSGVWPNQEIDQFYFWLDLIQLAEDIFVDLKLDDKRMWKHPMYAGWKRLFEYWASREELQKVWGNEDQPSDTREEDRTGQRWNYGTAFMYFFDELIRNDKASKGKSDD